MTPAPEEIGVVVPTHDEERRFGACLAVITSSRRDGRAAGGFSDLLRSLS